MVPQPIHPLKKWLHNLFAAPICSCGNPHTENPFCMTCGDANPKFDKAAFEAKEGMTIEETIKAECSAGHPDHHEGMKDDPDIHRKYPFCGYCGGRVCD